ncbi:glycerol kinase [Bacillus canaveralius]|uniref:glycerol kinase n=1 Tax=Bacillus canaveralius TaxID=1403243 RepID=A0A2N5GMR2_9BACI|nr:glycerol kinase GlpK [Bacillus canaveralius]PLR83303.1 glycerol kinase [Bacillus canaveralius]PLR96650.1 glycerol kinase [Bacillus canaveralius]
METTVHILAIDQSTSGTKVLLVNSDGVITHQKNLTHNQYYPQPGWAEHDPIEIYDNVKSLITEVCVSADVLSNLLKVVAITNQRETIVVWDKETGLPVHNAIVWQCRRTSDMCKELKDKGFETIIRAKTGLTLDPYFSASKVKWLMDHIEGVKQKAQDGKLLLGTIDSWLIWKLTKGKVHSTDYTNASRTLLFNIHSLQWDDELLEIFQIPRSMLPEVKDSNAIFGMTEDEDLPFSHIPISGVIGDSQGALFGQKCFEQGMAKATYGTGTSVLMHTENLIQADNGLVTSIAWAINGEVSYALEGIIHSTGDTIKWMKEDLKLIDDLNGIENLAGSIPDNQGVYLIPAFVGLGVPYWNPYARAAVMGISRNTGRAHFVRAALESIAYQVKDAVELMQSESNIYMKQLKVDGGATKNNFLMQFQSDMLGIDLVVSNVSELSALGAAYMAGLGVHIWNSTAEINNLNKEIELYRPKMSNDVKNQNYKGWKQAVNSVLVQTKNA